MTQVTPPGWYPDPGQKQDGPPTERWWDGTAWTARIRRTAPSAPATPDAGAAAGRAETVPGRSPGDDAPSDDAPPGRAEAGEADTGDAGSAGPADTGPTSSGPARPVDAPAGRAADGQAGVEQPAAGLTGAGPADPGRAVDGQATASHADAGQAAGAAPAAEGRAGAVQADAGQAGPGQAGGGWAAVGPPVPGYGGHGADWGPVETLGGGLPGHPVHPAVPPSPRGRRLRVGTAVAVAAAVLASIGVGVYALTDDDGGRSTATSQQPGGRDDGRNDGRDAPEEGAPDREGDEPRRVESGAVTDSLSGISLPVPDGWYGEELQVGAALTSKESYDCPGDTSKTCVKGGAYSAPAVVLGTRGDTAEEVAKADISANAEESYGGESYGRITSHDVLASKAVTVAGQKGYLVRWKAVTQKGSDGFVQSLAFPSPDRPDQIVVVRFGVDTDQQQKILDEITEGIEVAEGGRGNGQDV